MFTHNATVLAQMRAEEMARQPRYDRLVRRQQVSGSPLWQQMLAATGRLLIRWGMALERRYDRGQPDHGRTAWFNGSRPLGGAL